MHKYCILKVPQLEYWYNIASAISFGNDIVAMPDGRTILLLLLNILLKIYKN